MVRSLIYCAIVILSFLVGIFIVNSLHKNPDERVVNVQKFEENSLERIVSQTQTKASQDDDLLPLEFDKLKVNGIGFGTSHSNVLRQLGKPLQSKKTGNYPCGDLEKTLRYSGLTVILERNSKTREYNVVSMYITSNKWSISGIRVGASKNEVLEHFKYRHHFTNQPDSEGLHYSNGNGGTSFYFRNNKLVEINLESNWC